MEYLTEIEEVGLGVLALIRSGQLTSFKCATCSESMQKDRNCEADSEFHKPIYSHAELGEFYSCPIKFISESLYSFIDQYDYYEKYPASAPSYDDVNPRYWAALKFYEDIKIRLTPKDSESKNTDDNMSKMAALFKNKGV